MSDLSDLADEIVKGMSVSVRKVLDTAVENGWQLRDPGMTLAIRLDKPDDEIARPVYVTWKVGRTPKGALSFKAWSSAAAGLKVLSASDVLEYLKDPTVAYMLPEEEGLQIEWDETKTTAENVKGMLGGTEIEQPRVSVSSAKAAPSRGNGPPLRVQAPALRVSRPSSRS